MQIEQWRGVELQRGIEQWRGLIWLLYGGLVETHSRMYALINPKCRTAGPPFRNF